MDANKVFEAAKRNDFDAVKMFIEKGGVPPTIKMKISSYLHSSWEQTLANIAARNGNLKMLKYLIQKDLSILIKDKRTGNPDDLTILEEAVEKGAVDVVKYLVEEHNANIFESWYESSRFKRNTPVKRAVCCGHLNVTKYFVEERHVNVDEPCETGRSYCWEPALLFEAIYCQKRNIIKYLIEERKADLTVVDEQKENILFEAVRKADLGIKFMKYILDEKKAKIDINWRNKNGQTVLWTAVLCFPVKNQTDVVQYLVREKDADVNIPDKKQQKTPLHVVISNHGRQEILKYLVDCGANITQKDNKGDTPLHAAASSKYINYEDCKYLIEHGADVDQRNNEGKTPLDIAISNNKYKVTECIIKYGGVDISRKNENGETLVHVAAVRDNSALLEYLVDEKHADVNAERTSDGWTPLHCAAFWNNYKSCEYLIEHGANATAEGTCGKTPAQVASDKRLIEYLRKVSRTTRKRRDVGYRRFSAFPLNSTAYERTRLGIAGNANENSSNSFNDAQLRIFRFQSFLLFTRWFVRYLLGGSFSARVLQGEQSSAWSGEVVQDPIAEAAVGTLAMFEET